MMYYPLNLPFAHGGWVPPDQKWVGCDRVLIVDEWQPDAITLCHMAPAEFMSITEPRVDVLALQEAMVQYGELLRKWGK